MENKENNKEVEIEEVSVKDGSATESEEKKEENVADKTGELEQQLAEMKDKYLRAVAELENTRRRMSLDIESTARNRSISVAQKFLPVMDAVESALKLAPDDEGIQSMAKAMESAFTQIGIVKIESVGKELNPQLHNVIQVVPSSSDSEVKPNTIIQEMQTGYMFGDTVMRPSMVIVSK